MSNINIVPSELESALIGYVHSEDEAVAIARDHLGTVIVDLDETLYLRNSTEQFIALAKPGIVAALLLRFLDTLAPWRWVGGSECKDNWRIMLVITLFPWTLMRWRRFCLTEATKFVNVRLQSALREHEGSTVLASNGYRRLIEPMLVALNLPDTRLICCDIIRFSHRSRGKLELVRQHIEEDEIASSAVITDSSKDGPLLAKCAMPCLTVWDAARYEGAFRSVIYFPGDYVSQIKRPGQRALRSLAKDDLLPWVLAGLSVSPSLLECGGLACLFLSMWCFYEIGYFDNDRCALSFEEDSKTTAEVSRVCPMMPVKAAITGVFLGAAGIALVAPGWRAEAFLLWLAVLTALTLIYRLYNRMDKDSRVWLYLPLQMFRSGALFLVVSGNAVGYALAGSQMVARWIDYIIYRYLRQAHGISSFPKRPQKTVRLLIGLLMLLPLILHAEWRAFLVPAVFGFVYYLFEAVRWERRQVLGTAHRLDRQGDPLRPQSTGAASQRPSTRSPWPRGNGT